MHMLDVLTANDLIVKQLKPRVDVLRHKMNLWLSFAHLGVVACKGQSRARRFRGTHVVLDVGLASRAEQHPARLVVAILTAQVQRREAAAIPQVVVGLGLAQELHSLAESLPCGLVEGRVAVLRREEREKNVHN